MNAMLCDVSHEVRTPSREATHLRLTRLLSESMDSVVERERNSLNEIIGSLDKDFILFGAGNLGRNTLQALRRIGKEPAAFMDNNPALWGSTLLGLSVLSPEECTRRFDPARVGVITTIWCGDATDKMSDRICPLRKLGFANIAQFGHLAWMTPDDLLPYFSLDRPSKVIAQADRISAAFELLSDDDSRRLFVDHVEWRLFLDFDLLSRVSPQTVYFDRNYFSASRSEVLYDIGAYTGDSVESFLNTERGSAFSEIHCFEPAQDNFVKLQTYVSALNGSRDKFFTHQLALGDEIGSIRVETDRGTSTRVGYGDATVGVTTVDAFTEGNASPTLMKIDIEGFEPKCLAGARETIANTAPVIAVCLYHVQAHLWDVLLQLSAYRSDYVYRLDQHRPDGWDLLLYAVPKHRAAT